MDRLRSTNAFFCCTGISVVARGRDLSDVSPVKGLFSGGAHKLTTELQSSRPRWASNEISGSGGRPDAIVKLAVGTDGRYLSAMAFSLVRSQWQGLRPAF